MKRNKKYTNIIIIILSTIIVVLLFYLTFYQRKDIIFSIKEDKIKVKIGEINRIKYELNNPELVINWSSNNENFIINEEGEIVLDAKLLLEIVRKIDSEFINVETIDGTLIKISGGNSEFKINGMLPDEYPSINFDYTLNNPFKLETSLFNQIINETAFACSDKEIKPVLTGVNLKAKDHKIYANATDSYRLASKTIDIDTDLNFDITVPAKYLTEIYHALANEKEITIAIDKQKISFVFNNTIIDTRLLDDEYPDTSRLIPSNFTQKLKVSSKEMINAIDRTLFIKSDGKNTIKLNINDEKIELTSSNQNYISSFEEIKVISFEGSPLEISCSGKYLQDAIKAVDADEVVISFSGELKPMVVTREEDDSLIQLISPVRTYK